MGQISAIHIYSNTTILIKMIFANLWSNYNYINSAEHPQSNHSVCTLYAQSNDFEGGTLDLSWFCQLCVKLRYTIFLWIMDIIVVYYEHLHF